MTVTDDRVATAAQTRRRMAANLVKKRERRKTITVRICQVLIFVAVLGSWEVCARTGVVDPSFFSQPSLVVKALGRGIGDGTLLRLLGTTLYETIVGYLIAVVSGFLVGVVLAEFDMLNRIMQPFLTAFNNVPRIALAPLFVIWFGLGSSSRIILTFTLVFVVIVYNTQAGLQSVRREHLMLARSLGFSLRARYTKFILPTALPSIFAGLQLGLALALTGAIVGEMLTGNAGLGGYMQYQVNTFGTDQFFAALTLLVVASLIISAAMRLLERVLLRWQRTETR
jgi:NitT/TauT family transport system permease protein